MKKLLIIIVSIIFLLFGLVLLRGNEDSWLCQNNQWIKHGFPSYPKPESPCGKKLPLPKNKNDCLKAQGVWKKQGPEPFETCNIKASDRGNICTDNGECEGWCQANLTRDELRQGMSGKTFVGKGQCSVWRVELGCFGMLKQGRISTICID